MSTLVNVSNAVKNARALQWPARLNNGTLKFYTGTMPATPDTAITTQTLLLTFSIPATSGTVTDNVFNGVDLGEAVVVADGFATWARSYNSSGDAVIDWSVSTSSAAIILDNADLVTGAIVTITAWALTE